MRPCGVQSQGSKLKVLALLYFFIFFVMCFFSFCMKATFCGFESASSYDPVIFKHKHASRLAACLLLYSLPRLQIAVDKSRVQRDRHTDTHRQIHHQTSHHKKKINYPQRKWFDLRFYYFILTDFILSRG